MRLRTITLATLAAAFALGAASPAFADWDNRHHRDWRRHEWRERAWREHEWRERAWRDRHELRYYRPPVVVAPAYPYAYGY